MVDKKRRIARNPKSKIPSQKADEWINQGGIDPEISTSQPSSEQSKEEVGTGKSVSKKYPHRISFDLSDAQYKRLKWSSFDSNRPMNVILREAVEEWLKAHDY